MRLKIRHATRRSQVDIDNDFNPINLDYIFEEDDPLTPWLENLEAPLLDGQDNSDWLSGDETGVASTSAQPRVPEVPTESGSGSGQGLSPLSDIPSGSDSASNPPPHPHYGSTGVSAPHEVVSPARNYGHADLHAYRDVELQEEHGRQRTSLPSGSTRRASFRLSVTDSDDDMSQTMSDLDLGRRHSHTHPYPPYPYPPPLMYPQPYPYLVVPQPYPYPYPHPHAQPMYHPFPQPHDPSHDIASMFFGQTVPSGYNHQSAGVQEQSERSSSPMDASVHQYEDVEHDYVEPARNSFWW